jgi:hypothetical protein
MTKSNELPLVPTVAMLRRQARGFEWKRRARVARLRRLTLAQAIRETEELLSLPLPLSASRRPSQSDHRIVLK